MRGGSSMEERKLPGAYDYDYRAGDASQELGSEHIRNIPDNDDWMIELDQTTVK